MLMCVCVSGGVSINRAGYIIPKPGVNEAFDACAATEKDAKEQLNAILLDARREFGDRNIKFTHRLVCECVWNVCNEQVYIFVCLYIACVNRNKEKFQLEIKKTTTNKHSVPAQYEMMSQTKTVQRFWSDDIRDLVAVLEQSEFDKGELLKGTTRQVLVCA
jgi:DNA mismatch repair ATPase MutS